MDWTAGYASDVEYISGFYREQSPSHLNFVCVVNGYEPIPLDQPFTYFELGFGRGLTANVLAAGNPQGSFFAADFNPAQVAGARQLCATAELPNLKLLEQSFLDLANGLVDLPLFDFITLHGIYTWVTAENRGHIVNFISRYLKPGGIVYVSYNAMPGWSAALPLQRLLVEFGDLHPGDSETQLRGAASLVEKMASAQAGYFKVNPALKPRLDLLQTGKTPYLVHEYMHHAWQPLYHADVARDFQVAKLNYIGSADLSYTYPALYLTPETEKILNEIPDVVMRETLKDYFLNTGFRKDTFVRGARKMGIVRQTEWLQKVGLALLKPRDSISLIMKTSIGEVSTREAIYLPILDALAKRPHLLAELASLPELAGQPTAVIAQAASMLTASGQAEIYFTATSEQDVSTAHSLNRAIAAHTRYGDDYQVLVSPLLGTGIATTFVERVIYQIVANRLEAFDVRVVTHKVGSIMSALGQRLSKDGISAETDAENLALLEPQVRSALEDKLPIWRHLKII